MEWIISDLAPLAPLGWRGEAWPPNLISSSSLWTIHGRAHRLSYWTGTVAWGFRFPATCHNPTATYHVIGDYAPVNGLVPTLRSFPPVGALSLLGLLVVLWKSRADVGGERIAWCVDSIAFARLL